MAKRVITTTEFTDDLDGSKAERTVSFAFDGTQYEIDLSKKNRGALEKALGPYIDAGRRVPSSRRRRGSARSTSSKERLGDIREWARKNGYEVSDRGRIPGSVMEAYQAAQ